MRFPFEDRWLTVCVSGGVIYYLDTTANADLYRNNNKANTFARPLHAVLGGSPLEI
jgi:hypothetical protein